MNRERARVTSASVVFVFTALALGQAEADLVRQALCTEGDVTREIELRSIAGAADVCDIVIRTVGEPIEERVMHPAAPRSALCAARFERAVRASRDRGWQCSIEPSASDVPVSSPSPSLPRSQPQPQQEEASESESFARTWRRACVTAQAETRADAETLCDCAIDRLRGAGFEERDFEVLASPYSEAGVDRPVHQAGLLYGVGMMAVDALARCEVP